MRDEYERCRKDAADEDDLLEGKGGGSDAHRPGPARVDAGTKQVLLDLVDHAEDEGWPAARACEVLGLQERRLRPWRHRADTGAGLLDARPGASVNALTPVKIEAILEAFETFGEGLLPPAPGPPRLL